MMIMVYTNRIRGIYLPVFIEGELVAEDGGTRENILAVCFGET